MIYCMTEITMLPFRVASAPAIFQRTVDDIYCKGWRE